MNTSRFRNIVAALLVCVLTLFAPGAYAQQCASGPDTCLPGFVWREAFAGDHVCVTGATRTQAQQENALANQRRSPNGGPFGPDTCLPGFVWREASPADHVCVPGTSRTQAAADNAQASARRDPQCADPAANDTTPPAFIENTLSFVRVPDNLQVGTEVIPTTGITKSPVARDRRFVIAASAGDNESGIASISVTGAASTSCNMQLDGTVTNPAIQLGTQSDEVKSGTAATGSPALRSAHFSIDPFAGDATRHACSCRANAGPLTATLRIVVRNGKGLVTTSAPITVVYPAQAPTCGAASGEVCGNKDLGQVLACASGGVCDFKRSTVCSGFWIFRTCDKIQTTDMFCP
jgi:hypothetical protein